VAAVESGSGERQCARVLFTGDLVTLDCAGLERARCVQRDLDGLQRCLGTQPHFWRGQQLGHAVQSL
jgi:hypothetical protein